MADLLQDILAEHKAHGKVIAIASVTKSGGIGYKGELVVRDRKDMNWFRQATMGHTVLSGRRTGETLALVGRKHVTVSRSQGSTVSGQAKTKHNDLFVIGGAEIYQQSLPECDYVYLTQHRVEAECDTWFPMAKLHELFELQGQTIKSLSTPGSVIQIWARKQV